MIKRITICERNEIEKIVSEEIRKGYAFYPSGFEAEISIKSEVPGVYGLPGYVGVTVKVCPTKDVAELAITSGEIDPASPLVNPAYAVPGEPTANPLI